MERDDDAVKCSSSSPVIPSPLPKGTQKEYLLTNTDTKNTEMTPVKMDGSVGTSPTQRILETSSGITTSNEDHFPGPRQEDIKKFEKNTSDETHQETPGKKDFFIFSKQKNQETRKRKGKISWTL